MSPGIRALKFVYIAIAFFCFFLCLTDTMLAQMHLSRVSNTDKMAVFSNNNTFAVQR